jgi:peptidoglycan/LPS O-acetylase OafA/YrhL
VVVTHSPNGSLFGYPLLSGITAVQCFYVVSGFLITMVLNERKEYRTSVLNFYVSRYLRLWPAYAIVAILTLVFVKWSYLAAYLPKFDIFALSLVVFSNATIFFQDMFLFLALSADGTSFYPTAHFGIEPGPQVNGFLLVPQAWSLGVELTFYMVAPYFCRSPMRLGVLFLIGLVTRIIIGKWSPSPMDPWLYRFSPAEMALFSFGGLAYFGGLPVRNGQWPRYVGAASLALLILIVFVAHPFLSGLSHRLFLLNPVLVATIGISLPFLFQVSRGSHLDSMIGELSYPMYLSHIFVATVVMSFAPGLMDPKFGNLPYVIFTILFSILLLWLVILPVDRFRRRFGAWAPNLKGTGPTTEKTALHATP